jgi:hypothetical protein
MYVYPLLSVDDASFSAVTTNAGDEESLPPPTITVAKTVNDDACRYEVFTTDGIIVMVVISSSCSSFGVVIVGCNFS